MAKTKEQKKEIIEDLEKNIASQKAMVFLDFSKVDSPKLFDLRGKLQESGCLLKVVKKTLLEKTLEKLKNKDVLDKVKEIKEQLALAFGFEDELSPLKICYQLSKENENLKILGGFIEGEYLEQERMLDLAQIPSKQELLARLVGTLQSPVSNLRNVLNNNIKGLINIFKKVSK